MHTQIAAWVFDAYGTLFDPHSVQGKAQSIFPGQGDALSGLWPGGSVMPAGGPAGKALCTMPLTRAASV